MSDISLIELRRITSFTYFLYKKVTEEMLLHAVEVSETCFLQLISKNELKKVASLL